MGASKSKTIVWQLDRDNLDHYDFQEVSLERSTFQDKQQNLLGLPEDVFALIAVYLARDDLNNMITVAQVCKTWRRIAYKDFVWRSIARDKEINLDDDGKGSSVRVQVLNQVSVNIASDFIYLPQWMMDVLSDPKIPTKMTKKGRHHEYYIALYNYRDHAYRHLGTSCLAASFNYGHFEDPNIHDSYRRQMDDYNVIEVFDTHNQERLYRLSSLPYADAVIVCDVFDTAGAADDICSTIEDIVKQKKITSSATLPPIFVARTKSDLKLPFVERNKVMHVCRKYQLPFYCCSALEMINVKVMFHHMFLAVAHFKTQQK